MVKRSRLNKPKADGNALARITAHDYGEMLSELGRDVELAFWSKEVIAIFMKPTIRDGQHLILTTSMSFDEDDKKFVSRANETLKNDYRWQYWHIDVLPTKTVYDDDDED